jgi:hypothetical protein
MDDDIHSVIVEEEPRLEDHNEAENVGALFGGNVAININNDDDLPGAT